MTCERPVGTTGRRERLVCDTATSLARLAGYDNLARDPGSLGIIAAVARLSEGEALCQFEELRAASPDVQALGRVRMAALRRRLFGGEAVQP